MFFDNSLKLIVGSINNTLKSDYTTHDILDNTTFEITLYSYNYNVYKCTCIIEDVIFTFTCFWYKDNTISYNDLKVRTRSRCYC